MMELDELKSAWAQYDQKLSRSLALNEKLLRNINLKHSKNELEKPLMTEIFGVVSMAVMTAFFIGASMRVIDEPQYCIPGFISAAIALVYLAFSVVKSGKFLKIDYYGTSVIQLQQNIAEVNRLVLQLRKYELLLSPAILISGPLLFKVLHNVDVYSNMKSFLLSMAVVFVIGISATLLINKYLYDKKFQHAARLLKEIEAYKLEK
jgi:hypothetical protein